MKKVILFAAVLLLIVSCKKSSVKKTCCTSPPYVKEFWGGYILMPNVFTPDANGINDEFGPIHDGLIRWEMRVLDTKERVIYSTTDSEMWNGMNNGSPVNDIYGWKVVYHTAKAETDSIQGIVCIISDTDGICPKNEGDCLFATQADRPFINFDADLPSNEVLCID